MRQAIQYQSEVVEKSVTNAATRAETGSTGDYHDGTALSLEEWFRTASPDMGYDWNAPLSHPCPDVRLFWDEILDRLARCSAVDHGERGYVSRLWASDWDSPEDSSYDQR